MRARRGRLRTLPLNVWERPPQGADTRDSLGATEEPLGMHYGTITDSLWIHWGYPSTNTHGANTNKHCADTNRRSINTTRHNTKTNRRYMKTNRRYTKTIVSCIFPGGLVGFTC